MSERIWKFKFPINDNVCIDMPIGAEILTVQTQNNTPCIWAIVNPTKPRVAHRFCNQRDWSRS